MNRNAICNDEQAEDRFCIAFFCYRCLWLFMFCFFVLLSPPFHSGICVQKKRGTCYLSVEALVNQGVQISISPRYRVNVFSYLFFTPYFYRKFTRCSTGKNKKQTLFFIYVLCFYVIFFMIWAAKIQFLFKKAKGRNIIDLLLSCGISTPWFTRWFVCNLSHYKNGVFLCCKDNGTFCVLLKIKVTYSSFSCK